MNYDMIFEIVFSNDTIFKNINLEEAELILCTYKKASYNADIIRPIEIDKGERLCNEVYNAISQIIIRNKFDIFQNRKNSIYKDEDFEVDFSDMICDYKSLGDIAKKRFDYIIISDYIEFLKNCTYLISQHEEIIITKNYKKFISEIGLVFNINILNNYPESTDGIDDDEEYFKEKLIETHLYI